LITRLVFRPCPIPEPHHTNALIQSSMDYAFYPDCMYFFIQSLQRFSEIPVLNTKRLL
jgi:7-cyano-7-deazaguanine synthase in queuosine biosynthesis